MAKFSKKFSDILDRNIFDPKLLYSFFSFYLSLSLYLHETCLKHGWLVVRPSSRPRCPQCLREGPTTLLPISGSQMSLGPYILINLTRQYINTRHSWWMKCPDSPGCSRCATKNIESVFNDKMRLLIRHNEGVVVRV